LDHYSILGQNATGARAIPPLASDLDVKSNSLPALSPEPALFTDDRGKSLTEMAQRDLEAALQLLAERAQYITGASGAAIALLEGDEMICRASAGPSAPELGAEVQIKAGLTGESVRTRQVLRCDDAEIDLRVNRESCRSLGIRSVMVMPLIKEQNVIGVFELMADRVQAFEERDITALERLAEMVLTGLEHADAARRGLKEIAAKIEEALIQQNKAECSTVVAEKKESAPEILILRSMTEEGAVIEAVESKPEVRTLDKIRPCDACGFPVSEGRTLCVDCDASRLLDDNPSALAGNEAMPFFTQLGAPRREKSWLQTHFYTIGTILMALLTLVLLALRLR
jgi:putative methionine-R-sulfoxide reductase with GAF domain